MPTSPINEPIIIEYVNDILGEQRDPYNYGLVP